MLRRLHRSTTNITLKLYFNCSRANFLCKITNFFKTCEKIKHFLNIFSQFFFLFFVIFNLFCNCSKILSHHPLGNLLDPWPQEGQIFEGGRRRRHGNDRRFFSIRGNYISNRRVSCKVSIFILNSFDNWNLESRLAMFFLICENKSNFIVFFRLLSCFLFFSSTYSRFSWSLVEPA